jgi:tRNA pseudouridine38-40 synthase
MAHIDSERGEILKSAGFIHRINGLLHRDISVHSIHEVVPEAHARFDAVSRTYEYHIHRVKDPFLQAFSYYYHGPLAVDPMNEAAGLLIKATDFKSFSKVNTDVKTFTCDVMEALWKKDGTHLVFSIKADRFLRNMVRAIVGTLLEVGKGNLTVADFSTIIDSRDRSKAGMSAPAHGLTLANIKYPDELFL